MGSIEVFDYQRREWVPYLPNSSTPTDSVKELQEKLAAAEQKIKQLEVPEVKQVTPVAEAMERAQSQLQQQRKKGSVTQRKNPKAHEKSSTLPKSTKRLQYNPSWKS